MSDKNKTKEFMSYGNAFYFEEPKLNKRKSISGLIMLILFSLINPLLIIGLVIYLFYIIYKMKVYKYKENIEALNAISLYKKESYKESLIHINNALKERPDSSKFNIIKALNHFKLGEYEKYIFYIDKIPYKILKNDLDLQLKLGESYEKTKDYEKARNIYNKLHKMFPKSSYLKEKTTNLSR